MPKLKVQLVTHPCHLGMSGDDNMLTLIIRALSLKHGKLEDWPDKYGADYEDDQILIHHDCWCEKDDCPWCGGHGLRPEILFQDTRGYERTANFWHKPSGVRVSWYKYIGRDMEYSTSEISSKDLERVVSLVTESDMKRLDDVNAQRVKLLNKMFAKWNSSIQYAG